jgi:hypothetical protein
MFAEQQEEDIGLCTANQQANYHNIPTTGTASDVQ